VTREVVGLCAFSCATCLDAAKWYKRLLVLVGNDLELNEREIEGLIALAKGGICRHRGW
jgi:hypothetical protein